MFKEVGRGLWMLLTLAHMVGVVAFTGWDVYYLLFRISLQKSEGEYLSYVDFRAMSRDWPALYHGRNQWSCAVINGVKPSRPRLASIDSAATCWPAFTAAAGYSWHSLQSCFLHSYQQHHISRILPTRLHVVCNLRTSKRLLGGAGLVAICVYKLLDMHSVAAVAE